MRLRPTHSRLLECRRSDTSNANPQRVAGVYREEPGSAQSAHTNSGPLGEEAEVASATHDRTSQFEVLAKLAPMVTPADKAEALDFVRTGYPAIPQGAPTAGVA